MFDCCIDVHHVVATVEGESCRVHCRCRGWQFPVLLCRGPGDPLRTVCRPFDYEWKLPANNEARVNVHLRCGLRTKRGRLLCPVLLLCSIYEPSIPVQLLVSGFCTALRIVTCSLSSDRCPAKTSFQCQHMLSLIESQVVQCARSGCRCAGYIRDNDSFITGSSVKSERSIAG